MAKTKSSKRSKRRDKPTLSSAILSKSPAKSMKPAKATTSEVIPEVLLAEATALLQISQPQEALPIAHRALSILQPSSVPILAALPAINLLGEINVELGDIATARAHFLSAVSLDEEGLIPEAAGGGAEKFLWLAQICEEGGVESVAWFEKGIKILRRQLGHFQSQGEKGHSQEILENKQKLANALCGMVEVYMTDLSWEEDAEQRCERLTSEALLVAPDQSQPLQTLASVRISQLRLDDARAALSRSVNLWKWLQPGDPAVPDFPTRVSLSRLLIETEMYDEAIETLERLIGEDDNSIEVWYLGGWCLYLMGDKAVHNRESEEARQLRIAAREWLQNSLKIYELLEYEDEKLKLHATELVGELGEALGDSDAADEFDEDADELDGEEWEDDENAADKDEDMHDI